MSTRIRTIKPEWLEDERLGALSDSARLLSVALILLADDWGNGRAAVPYIVGRVWLYARDGSDVFATCSRALRELVENEFIVLYHHRGQTYYHIRKWFDHQKVDKAGRPHCPIPKWVVDSLPRDPPRWRKQWKAVVQKYGVEPFEDGAPNDSRAVRDSLATDLDLDRDRDLDPDPDLDREHRARAHEEPEQGLSWQRVFAVWGEGWEQATATPPGTPHTWRREAEAVRREALEATGGDPAQAEQLVRDAAEALWRSRWWERLKQLPPQFDHFARRFARYVAEVRAGISQQTTAFGEPVDESWMQGGFGSD